MPIREDVLQRVREVIAGVKGVPAETISADSTFEELGIDSLDGFNVLFELEKTFDLSIPDEQAKDIHSVAEAVLGIERLLAASGAAPDA
jgi:acyl carrier protein